MGTPYGTQIEAGSSYLSKLRKRYQGMGQDAGSNLATIRPQANTALANLSSFYRQGVGPGERQRFIGQQTQNVSDSFLRGLSALQARNAANGQDSYSAGQAAALEGRRAAAFGQAENQANVWQDQQEQSKREALFRLLSGMERQGVEDQRYALGQEGQANNGLLELYLSLSNAEKARAAAAQQNRLGALGSLLGTAGSIYGMSRGGFGGGSGGGGGTYGPAF